MPEFTDLQSWRETLDALPLKAEVKPLRVLRHEIAPGVHLKIANPCEGCWEIWLNHCVIGEGSTVAEAMAEANAVLEAASDFLTGPPAPAAFWTAHREFKST